MTPPKQLKEIKVEAHLRKKKKGGVGQVKQYERTEEVNIAEQKATKIQVKLDEFIKKARDGPPKGMDEGDHILDLQKTGINSIQGIGFESGKNIESQIKDVISRDSMDLATILPIRGMMEVLHDPRYVQGVKDSLDVIQKAFDDWGMETDRIDPFMFSIATEPETPSVNKNKVLEYFKTIFSNRYKENPNIQQELASLEYSINVTHMNEMLPEYIKAESDGKIVSNEKNIKKLQETILPAEMLKNISINIIGVLDYMRKDVELVSGRVRADINTATNKVIHKYNVLNKDSITPTHGTIYDAPAEELRTSVIDAMKGTMKESSFNSSIENAKKMMDNFKRIPSNSIHAAIQSISFASLYPKGFVEDTNFMKSMKQLSNSIIQTYTNNLKDASKSKLYVTNNPMEMLNMSPTGNFESCQSVVNNSGENTVTSYNANVLASIFMDRNNDFIVAALHETKNGTEKKARISYHYDQKNNRIVNQEGDRPFGVGTDSKKYVGSFLKLLPTSAKGVNFEYQSDGRFDEKINENFASDFIKTHFPEIPKIKELQGNPQIRTSKQLQGEMVSLNDSFFDVNKRISQNIGATIDKDWFKNVAKAMNSGSSMLYQSPVHNRISSKNIDKNGVKNIIEAFTGQLNDQQSTIDSYRKKKTTEAQSPKQLKEIKVEAHLRKKKKGGVGQVKQHLREEEVNIEQPKIDKIKSKLNEFIGKANEPIPEGLGEGAHIMDIQKTGFNTIKGVGFEDGRHIETQIKNFLDEDAADLGTLIPVNKIMERLHDPKYVEGVSKRLDVIQGAFDKWGFKTERIDPFVFTILDEQNPKKVTVNKGKIEEYLNKTLFKKWLDKNPIPKGPLTIEQQDTPHFIVRDIGNMVSSLHSELVGNLNNTLSKFIQVNPKGELVSKEKNLKLLQETIIPSDTIAHISHSYAYGRLGGNKLKNYADNNEFRHVTDLVRNDVNNASRGILNENIRKNEHLPTEQKSTTFGSLYNVPAEDLRKAVIDKLKSGIERYSGYPEDMNETIKDAKLLVSDLKKLPANSVYAAVFSISESQHYPKGLVEDPEFMKSMKQLSNSIVQTHINDIKNPTKDKLFVTNNPVEILNMSPGSGVESCQSVVNSGGENTVTSLNANILSLAFMDRNNDFIVTGLHETRNGLEKKSRISYWYDEKNKRLVNQEDNRSYGAGSDAREFVRSIFDKLPVSAKGRPSEYFGGGVFDRKINKGFATKFIETHFPEINKINDLFSNPRISESQELRDELIALNDQFYDDPKRIRETLGKTIEIEWFKDVASALNEGQSTAYNGPIHQRIGSKRFDSADIKINIERFTSWLNEQQESLEPYRKKKTTEAQTPKQITEVRVKTHIRKKKSGGVSTVKQHERTEEVLIDQPKVDEIKQKEIVTDKPKPKEIGGTKLDEFLKKAEGGVPKGMKEADHVMDLWKTGFNTIHGSGFDNGDHLNIQCEQFLTGYDLQRMLDDKAMVKQLHDPNYVKGVSDKLDEIEKIFQDLGIKTDRIDPFVFTIDSPTELDMGKAKVDSDKITKYINTMLRKKYSGIQSDPIRGFGPYATGEHIRRILVDIDNIGRKKVETTLIPGQIFENLGSDHKFNGGSFYGMDLKEVGAKVQREVQDALQSETDIPEKYIGKEGQRNIKQDKQDTEDIRKYVIGKLSSPIMKGRLKSKGENPDILIRELKKTPTTGIVPGLKFLTGHGSLYPSGLVQDPNFMKEMVKLSSSIVQAWTTTAKNPFGDKMFITNNPLEILNMSPYGNFESCQSVMQGANPNVSTLNANVISSVLMDKNNDFLLMTVQPTKNGIEKSARTSLHYDGKDKKFTNYEGGVTYGSNDTAKVVLEDYMTQGLPYKHYEIGPPEIVKDFIANTISKEYPEFEQLGEIQHSYRVALTDHGPKEQEELHNTYLAVYDQLHKKLDERGFFDKDFDSKWRDWSEKEWFKLFADAQNNGESSHYTSPTHLALAHKRVNANALSVDIQGKYNRVSGEHDRQHKKPDDPFKDMSEAEVEKIKTDYLAFLLT